METKRVVNIDFIPVIRQIGNQVKLEQLEIEKPVELISDLRVMLENPNHTILDLQSRMCIHFKEGNRKSTNLISPYTYSSSYITDYVPFPKIYSMEEYEELVKDMEESAKRNNTYILKKAQEKSEEKYQEVLAECIAKVASSRKQSYHSNCIHYINGVTYQATIAKCKKDPSIKMHTIESCGWRTVTHTVNSDIEMSVDTNFGYGWSSYFYLCMKYKGIKILPYSFIVNYYFANMRDICRCTRNYPVYSYSWETALKFVEEATNLAAENPERFCNAFIKNEIQAMLSGLGDIIRNPQGFVNRFVTGVNHERGSYIGVRNISCEDKKIYSTFPEDMPIAYLAEKITNAYELLENLKELGEVYPLAIDAIDKIKSLSEDALPKLEISRTKNNNAIESLRARLEIMNGDLNSLKEKEKEYSLKIESIYEAQKEKDDAKSYYTIQTEYESDHPEYTSLKKEISEIEEGIRDKESEVRARESFISQIEECIKTIEGC